MIDIKNIINGICLGFKRYWLAWFFRTYTSLGAFISNSKVDADSMDDLFYVSFLQLYASSSWLTKWFFSSFIADIAAKSELTNLINLIPQRAPRVLKSLNVYTEKVHERVALDVLKAQVRLSAAGCCTLDNCKLLALSLNPMMMADDLIVLNTKKILVPNIEMSVTVEEVALDLIHVFNRADDIISCLKCLALANIATEVNITKVASAEACHGLLFSLNALLEAGQLSQDRFQKLLADDRKNLLCYLSSVTQRFKTVSNRFITDYIDSLLQEPADFDSVTKAFEAKLYNIELVNDIDLAPAEANDSSNNAQFFQSNPIRSEQNSPVKRPSNEQSDSPIFFSWGFPTPRRVDDGDYGRENPIRSEQNSPVKRPSNEQSDSPIFFSWGFPTPGRVDDGNYGREIPNHFSRPGIHIEVVENDDEQVVRI